jgi:uncharacterized protein YndB with AHSA1/START domain
MPRPEAAEVQVYRIYIKADAPSVWDALTKPEWTVHYGYAPVVSYELRPGGHYRAYPNDEMKAVAGVPPVIVDGEVLEVDPPRRLVQTWRMLLDPTLSAEGFTRLTHTLETVRGGVTRLTVTHELAGAPALARVVAGEMFDRGAGGGWSEVLSGLKTVLETGARMPFQTVPTHC